MPEWYDWMADEDDIQYRDNSMQIELLRYQQALLRSCAAIVEAKGLTCSIEQLADKYLSGEQYD